ncbi:MAG: N-6 DNA methylase [Actinomycetota bacterium]
MIETDRKSLGAWYTPTTIVSMVVDAVVDPTWVAARSGAIRVVDPACGDGRFLRAAIDRLRDAGAVVVEAVGVDVDPAAASAAREMVPEATVVVADALGDVWTAFGRLGRDDARSPRAGELDGFDLVVGNPPYLSQMATSTARGGASRHGGGPYADVAVEFLALGARLVDRAGGRLGFVLPQSLLSTRDAAEVRRSIDERATMLWSSWTGERDFDAQVVTCALAFEFGRTEPDPRPWSSVVTARLGVPPVPTVLAGGTTAGVLGDRAWLNANFRDEYYGMIPAVGDHEHGPPLVTSGLIDPGRCRWGDRPVRFAKRDFAAPRLDLAALDPRMRAWATRRLRPKVLVANQTKVLEAVADPTGDWLPGVPVVAVYPEAGHAPSAVGDGVWEIAAVLTSASASAWAWHERGGTGLSATAIRVGPVMLGELPWPGEPLDDAVAALRSGDVLACGRAVDRAFGVGDDEARSLADWWEPTVSELTSRM